VNAYFREPAFGMVPHWKRRSWSVDRLSARPATIGIFVKGLRPRAGGGFGPVIGSNDGSNDLLHRRESEKIQQRLSKKHLHWNCKRGLERHSLSHML